MHANPVKRGLVKDPGAWMWSSFFYAKGEPGLVAIDSVDECRSTSFDLTAALGTESLRWVAQTKVKRTAVWVPHASVLRVGSFVLWFFSRGTSLVPFQPSRLR